MKMLSSICSVPFTRGKENVAENVREVFSSGE
jgi:hypothetical protein